MLHRLMDISRATALQLRAGALTRCVSPLRCSVQHLPNPVLARRGTTSESLSRLSPWIRSINLRSSRSQLVQTSPFSNKTSTAPRWNCSVSTVAAEEEQVSAGPVEKFRVDYKPPAYSFASVNLHFVLEEERTRVLSTILVDPTSGGPLELDGEELELISLHINGEPVPESGYKRTAHALTLLTPPLDRFELKVETGIYPHKNTALEGLYKSSGMFCTQCEAEGFRRITYFQDRPDVMTSFRVRMEADAGSYPVLLSNGNLVEEGAMEGGRHFAVWEDPWKKPSYLFALVAGQLACSEDKFRTASGREVVLRIYVVEGEEKKTAHAMRSLKASMKWDEEVYGLEYDLDLFNIVAVPSFNMGAMENKGLNVFNSRLVLATPETATDADYTAIEGVVAHEYFHNWTGNRVTCRDWFQLSLKEGLTVFRDQEFSADMNSRGVKRIADVQRLRSSQFSQDAGPMAHPIRPESYIKVYEKGAEVVRIYQTLMGKEAFRKGMDLYFKRHDGQAVTCDDFLSAMRDANDARAELEGFERWYSQAGTPVVTVRSEYDAEQHTFTLHCKQATPPTPGASEKAPLLLPLAVGLLGRSGADLPLTDLLDGDTSVHLPPNCTTAVLRMRQAEQRFTFRNVPERPVPSLLRNFSAPVRLVSDMSSADLQFLLANDSDQFNRWEAGQALARRMMLPMVAEQQGGGSPQPDPAFMCAMESVLRDESLDKAFMARVLSLPGESELAELMEVADPDAIHAVRKAVQRQLAEHLKPLLLAKVEGCVEGGEYSPDPASKAARSLKSVCLMYLAILGGEGLALADKAYRSASNMTDQVGALAAICQTQGPAREAALEAFYEQWKGDSLVMNKWLGLQASAAVEGNVGVCERLLTHPAFDLSEPNKVYALVGGFCGTPLTFHANDGSGYRFLADCVLKLDDRNPQVAARMVSAFTRWRKYDEKRQQLAKVELERILAKKELSDNVYEIVSRSLAG